MDGNGGQSAPALELNPPHAPIPIPPAPPLEPFPEFLIPPPPKPIEPEPQGELVGNPMEPAWNPIGAMGNPIELGDESEESEEDPEDDSEEDTEELGVASSVGSVTGPYRGGSDKVTCSLKKNKGIERGRWTRIAYYTIDDYK